MLRFEFLQRGERLDSVESRKEVVADIELTEIRNELEIGNISDQIRSDILKDQAQFVTKQMHSDSVVASPTRKLFLGYHNQMH